jgi:hypothetical protein
VLVVGNMVVERMSREEAEIGLAVLIGGSLW